MYVADLPIDVPVPYTGDTYRPPNLLPQQADAIEKVHLPRSACATG